MSSLRSGPSLDDGVESRAGDAPRTDRGDVDVVVGTVEFALRLGERVVVDIVYRDVDTGLDERCGDPSTDAPTGSRHDSRLPDGGESRG